MEPEDHKFFDQVDYKSDKEKPQSYGFRLDLLGHEIFKIELNSSSTTDRWAIMTMIWVFCTLIILGAYSDKLISLVKFITGQQ